MRDHDPFDSRPPRPRPWGQVFDTAAIVVVCAVPVALRLAGAWRATWNTVGAGAAGALFVTLAVLLQVRVGFAYRRHRRFRSVCLLLAGLAVWFIAAVCAVVGDALTVPSTVAAVALLAGALREPMDASVRAIETVAHGVPRRR